MFKRLSTGLLAAALLTTVGAAPAFGQPPVRPPVDVTITDVALSEAGYYDPTGGVLDPGWGCTMTITATLSGITKGRLMAAAEVHTTDYGGQWFDSIGGPPFASPEARTRSPSTQVCGIHGRSRLSTLPGSRSTPSTVPIE